MIKIANAPVSWGVLEFDLDGENASYSQVLQEMQETGYDGTELGDWGFLPTKAEHLKMELLEHQLTLLAGFVPVALSDPSAHARGEAAAIRTARLLEDVAGETAFIVLSDDNGQDANRTLNAGRIQPKHGLKDVQWKVFIEGTQRIAQAVAEQTGLQTVFHHHCGGFVETPEEVHQLMSLTNPDLIGLCLDTGHYQFGGGDSLVAVKQFSDRIRHVHFKDFNPDVAARSRAEGWDYFESVRQGVFCELGQGEVDFPAIEHELKINGYDGWIVVEQDVLPGMGTPRESAQNNRDYLLSIGI
ncbi:MAG: TIM barrel protein [Anaerolineae bacterium]|nr:TIM barrel protein [Anaerolineae bacterium]MDK1119017.1 TIM barrel protein [Anaerolineae bacterium]